MTEKTTVTITAPDGKTNTFTADTVITFTVDKALEHLKGDAEAVESRVAYVGKPIPDPAFEKTIGSLFSSFIEKNNNPVMASFYLHVISEFFEKRSKEIKDSISVEQKEAEVKNTLRGLFENMMKDLFD